MGTASPSQPRLRKRAASLDRESAVERIVVFAQRFGEPHMQLACHAAFPLVLTPDLLYQIWVHFTPRAPWTAVADMLLSSLCHEVGYEMYEMDLAVRNLLLEQLEAEVKGGLAVDEGDKQWRQRLNDLSAFLRHYVARELESANPERRALANAQRRAALIYTQPEVVAHELWRAAQLTRATSRASDDSNKVLAESLRLYAFIETFERPLAEYKDDLINALPQSFLREIGLARPSRRYDSVSAGIEALANLIHDPRAQSIMVRVRPDLQSVRDNIKRLNNYMRLFDLFQELELLYDLIEVESNRLVSTLGASDGLVGWLEEARSVMAALRAAAERAELSTNETQWSARLNQVEEGFQATLDSLDVEPLESALSMLRRILNLEPSRIHARIAQVARLILQSNLIARLTELRDALANLNVDAARLTQFNQGISALYELNDQLRTLANESEQWQSLQDELDRIEIISRRDADYQGLENSWSDVLALSRPLTEGRTEVWATSLATLDVRIQEAIQARADARVKPLLDEYRSRVSRQFRAINDQLLRVCEELSLLAERLDVLLLTAQ